MFKIADPVDEASLVIRIESIRDQVRETIAARDFDKTLELAREMHATVKRYNLVSGSSMTATTKQRIQAVLRELRIMCESGMIKERGQA